MAPPRGGTLHSGVLALLSEWVRAVGSVSKGTFLGALSLHTKLFFRLVTQGWKGPGRFTFLHNGSPWYHPQGKFHRTPNHEWSVPGHGPLGRPSHSVVNDVTGDFLKDPGICLVKMSIYPVQDHNLSHWKNSPHLIVKCAREVFPKDMGILLVKMSI